MAKKDEVVLLDDEGLLSPKEGVESDLLVEDLLVSEETQAQPTTALEEAQVFGIGQDSDEETPRPLDIAGDFAKHDES